MSNPFMSVDPVEEISRWLEGLPLRTPTGLGWAILPSDLIRSIQGYGITHDQARDVLAYVLRNNAFEIDHGEIVRSVR